MNDDSVRDGASTVIFVRDILLHGRRKDGAGKVLQDTSSHWFANRWLVAVHVGNDRDLSRGVARLFNDVCLPCAPCCV